MKNMLHQTILNLEIIMYFQKDMKKGLRIYVRNMAKSYNIKVIEIFLEHFLIQGT